MPQAGSAGAPQGGTGSAGAGGSATVPPGHACSPAIDVSGKSMLLLGTGATCLKTTAKFDYFTCSNWDTRIVQVNGAESPCWTMLNYPVPIDGYTYIEISAGTSAQATIAWSDLSTRI